MSTTIRAYQPLSFYQRFPQLHPSRRNVLSVPWRYVVRCTSTLKFHFPSLDLPTNYSNQQQRLIQSKLCIINQQQTRPYMSYRKKLQLKGGKKIIKVLPKDMCKVEFCHTKYDIKDYHERNRGYEDSDEDRDDSDHHGIFTVRFDVNSILRMADDYYGTAENVRNELEYYTHTTKNWKKFPTTAMKDDPDIMYYKGKGSRPIPLRTRSSYQVYNDGFSDDDDDAKNEKVIASRDEKPMVLDMLYIINQLSQRLTRLEYNRNSEDKYMIASKFINMNEPISIQNWLIQQMNIDKDLFHIVLRHPNSLQHISTCLAEFDHLWVVEEDPFIPLDYNTNPNDQKNDGKKKKKKGKNERVIKTRRRK
jgi:hypothetical protein